MPQDICISAVKELDIETKLKQIIADWAIVNLQFAPFKTRGELMLKGLETAEIIAQLEDSLMVISSLMASRYWLDIQLSLKSFPLLMIHITQLQRAV